MTYLVRPNLLDDLMVRGVSSPFEHLLSEPFTSNVTSKTFGLTPGMNLYEDSGNYYVLGVLPGVEPSKLDISVKENVLTISGEYNFSNWPQTQMETTSEKNQNGQSQNGQSQNGVRVLLNEIPEGKFTRQVKLAAAFESDKIQAHYDNGLLKLTLPKAERSQPKRINVTSAPQLNTVQA